MLQRISIRARLFLGFGIQILLLVGTLLYSHTVISTQVTDLTKLTAESLMLSNQWAGLIQNIQGIINDEMTLAGKDVDAGNSTASRKKEFDEMRSAIHRELNKANSIFETFSRSRSKYSSNTTSLDTKIATAQTALAEMENAVESFQSLLKATLDRAADESKLEEKAATQIADARGDVLTQIGVLEKTFLRLQNDVLEKQKSLTENEVTSIVLTLSIIGTLAVLIGIGGALAITGSVVTPVHKALLALEKTAKGDLTVSLPSDSKDEIGRLAAAFNQSIHSIRSTLSEVAESATSLSGSARQLSVVSQKLEGNASATSSESQTVLESSSNVTENIENVAASAEEMSVSIREIARNLSQSVKIAGSAVSAAESASASILKLGTSSAEINKVVMTIQSIAKQTNLLALNAAIEAARAGDAGKGFAVVAAEVEELAKTTSLATEEISKRIDAIQSDTRVSVSAITEIHNIILKINTFQQGIATTVDEQTLTTNEITRSIQEAAQAARSINENMSTVAETAASTSDGANQTRLSAKELAELSADLSMLIGQFHLKSAAPQKATKGPPKRATAPIPSKLLK